MNSIADIEDYDSYSFHYPNKYDQVRPLELTTQSQVYSLCINEKGYRQFVYDDSTGKPVATPRSLLMLCVNKIINDDQLLKKLNNQNVSANIFNLVFREAILFSEFSLIAHLISIWPSSYLKLSDLISSEIINADSLSKPMFSCGPTVLDYVLLGILISRPCSRLVTIDFTGFHRDLKLTREISHLSLLWLKPENRNFQNIHEKIKSYCYFEKNSLIRYLENFNEIYQEYDRLIQHENNYTERHLIIDCHINCEDVTLGLAMQYFTPFRFHARKVWCSYGFLESEYSFKNYDLLSLINPNIITHICIKDLFMIETPTDIIYLCSVFEKLNNLIALSLIRVLNFYPSNYSNEEINQVCFRINRTLRRSYKLRKIDLSFNFLRTRLFSLLRGLVQPLDYLNLQDCRLDSADISFLNTQPMLKVLRTVKELNLSMNDFSQSHSIVSNIISNCTHLNCLSISYCQIPIDVICQNLVGSILLDNNNNNTADNNDESVTKFSKLKVIYIQPFTPPKMHEIMDIIHSFSRIKSLEKFCFLPSLYAFPGTNDYEREKSATKIIQICSSILESKGRSDIEFINN